MNVFVLHKDNIDLARDEVINLLGKPKYRMYSNYLVTETELNESVLRGLSRLAYTREILELLFISSMTDFRKRLMDFDWQNIYRKDFSITMKGFVGSGIARKEVAKVIWNRVREPKVNLDSSQTPIYIVNTGQKIIVAKTVLAVKHDFQKRRAHLRPENYPASLSPKLARAMINLTGLKKGKVLDPFCGSGGILIEARLLGFDVTGYDISRRLLNKAKKNIEYYNLRCRLKEADSTELDGRRFDAIITELPFGRNTKLSEDKRSLYKKFFSAALKVTRKMVVSLPCDIRIRLKNWDASGKYQLYMHRSLTKRILVLEST